MDSIGNTALPSKSIAVPLLWRHVLADAGLCLLFRGKLFSFPLPSSGWLLFLNCNVIMLPYILYFFISVGGPDTHPRRRWSLWSEYLKLARLPGCSANGRIHVICNSRIGYTASRHISPSSTDADKIPGAPIFQVNGEDPDAMILCCNVDTVFRTQFHMDVIVDITRHRRKGHSEIAGPTPIEPVMYKATEQRPSTLHTYLRRLAEEKVSQGLRCACAEEYVLVQT
jgi:hypothetical protein